MITREHLESIIAKLKTRAKENQEEAIPCNEAFLKGLYEGYASAYEITAHWLEEILKAE